MKKITFHGLPTLDARSVGDSILVSALQKYTINEVAQVPASGRPTILLRLSAQNTIEAVQVCTDLVVKLSNEPIT